MKRLIILISILIIFVLNILVLLYFSVYKDESEFTKVSKFSIHNSLGEEILVLDSVDIKYDGDYVIIRSPHGGKWKIKSETVLIEE